MPDLVDPEKPLVFNNCLLGAPLEGRASARPQPPDVRKHVPPEETFKKIGPYIFVEICKSSIQNGFYLVILSSIISHFIILLLGQMTFSGSTDLL